MEDLKIGRHTVPIKALTTPQRMSAAKIVILSSPLDREASAWGVLGSVWAHTPPMPTQDPRETMAEYGARVGEVLMGAGYSILEVNDAADVVWRYCYAVITPPTQAAVDEALGNSEPNRGHGQGSDTASASPPDGGAMPSPG